MTIESPGLPGFYTVSGFEHACHVQRFAQL